MAWTGESQNIPRQSRLINVSHHDMKKLERLNHTLQEMSQSIHFILSYLLHDYFLYFVNLFENTFE